ncbi:MAG TPA: hypothetical protein VFN55_14725 [Solirubrobacteraceae bacterium]|nr:hypothetical protein [Solirubrobacteraceae bacterium]
MLAALSIVVALLMMGGSASAAYKPYSLTITTAGTTYNSQAGITGSGQTVTITATIVNEDSQQQLGSVDLYVPSSISVLGTPSISLPAPAYVTCGDSACSELDLRNLALPYQGAVTVTVTARTAACVSGQQTWQSVVKQANDFSGSPGNDFNLDTGDSTLYTTLDGACKLTFVKEPASAQVGAGITSIAYNPAGAPISVEVLGPSGTTAVPGSQATVDLAPGTGTPGTLGGVTSAVADGSSAALATFTSASGNGPTLSQPGLGDTLVASSGTLSSATSTSFDVQTVVATCQSGSSCTAQLGSTSNNASLSLSSGTDPGTLVGSQFTSSALESSICAGYASTDPNVYDSQFISSTSSSRTETDTLQFAPAKALKGGTPEILKDQQICFGSTVPFVTASGAEATPTTIDGVTIYAGILPTCTGSTSGPCHDRRQDTTVPDINSPTGYDIVLVDILPALWAADPYRC